MSADIFEACERADVDSIRTMLDEQPALVHATNANGASPLVLALQHGHVEAVRELLTRHVDPRTAQTSVTPSEHNAEAFAMVREASLRVDTLVANQKSQNTGSEAASNARSPDANAPPTNLPPPEIARMIPCKFFPNCRYGERCVFQHPVTVPTNGAYFASPPPPNVYYAGPNSMSVQPTPNPYGAPPPYFDMNHPILHQMSFGPDGLPMHPGPPMHPSPADAQGVHVPASNSEQSPPTGAQPQRAQQVQEQSSDVISRSKKSKASRGNTSQRRANDARPSCAFFARSACRYATECRFPHTLPDGTDARTLPSDQEAKLHQDPSRRAKHAAASRDVTASGTATPRSNGKKTHIQARRAGASAHARGMGARRGSGTPVHASRKAPAQRVPNSDDFPALPGGAAPSAELAPPAAGASTKSNKANFSTILSAPAPPKTKAPLEDGKMQNGSQAPVPAAPAPNAQHETGKNNAAAATPPTPSIISRDFAAVVAAQPNAIAA